MTRTITVFGVSVLAAVWMAGCTTVKEVFPREDPGHVWTALVAVAETPDYSDPDPSRRWFVKENHVWVDEERGRIEVYRELDRIRHLTSTTPLRENRTWRFQILFEGGDPPQAVFVSRGWGVPMQAHDEGRRYFADVWAMLGGAGEAAGPVEQVGAVELEAERQGAEQGKPIVDIDELEPAGGAER